MSLRGSFGGFYFVIAGYGKIKSSENDRKIAVSTQKAPKVRLMENFGLSSTKETKRRSLNHSTIAASIKLSPSTQPASSHKQNLLLRNSDQTQCCADIGCGD